MTPQGDIRDIEHVVILRQENRSYALADAYTVGDAYHCSVFGPTGPNRTYLWSGTINAGQQHGSYVAYGASDDELGRFLPWQSYPETLQAAGVSSTPIPACSTRRW